MTDLPRVKVAALATMAAAAALCATPAAAQTLAPPPTSPLSFLTTPAFADLVNKKSLVVRTKDGGIYEGHFRISANTLVMSNAQADTTLRFDEITRIQKSTYRIRTHVLIGTGVGAVAGGILAADYCGQTVYPVNSGPRQRSCGSEVFFFYAAGAGIGAGIGAGVGGILNKIHAGKDLVYDAGTRARTLAVAPILSPSRKGVSVVMTWR